MSKRTAVIAYRIAELAAALGVCKNTIHYWLDTGKIIEPGRDAVGRIWYIDDYDAVKKYSDSRSNKKSTAVLVKPTAVLVSSAKKP